jgi:hypothetical protein
MGVEPSRVVLADEDVQEDPDRWCSYTECGKATLANCVSMGMESAAHDFRKMMQGGELREMEWAPPTETAPLFFTWEDPPEEYGPWQCGFRGRTSGWSFDRRCFYRCREDGKLRCPAGASLWLSEVRQENAFTRARRLSRLSD